jgi:cell division protein FtsX
MGWLELLPLLKRILPLLSRIAPMLETYVATRAAGREDTQAVVDRLSGEFAVSAQSNHEQITATLAGHTHQLQQLSDEARQLSAMNNLQAARLGEVEQRVSQMQSTIRTLGIGTILLLVACIVLLAALLLRHSS